MTIRRQADGGLLLTGKYTVNPTPLTGPAITEAVKPLPLVALDVDHLISYVDPSQQGFKPGAHDLIRIVYDPSKVDPVTNTVKLSGMHHFIGGRFVGSVPTDESRLDLSAKPYRLTFGARVFHGQLVDVAFTPDGVAKVVDVVSGKTMISGPYTIDPAPIAVDAKTTPGAKRPN